MKLFLCVLVAWSCILGTQHLAAQDTVRSMDLRMGANSSNIYLLKVAPDTNTVMYPTWYWDSTALWDNSTAQVIDSISFSFQSYNSAAPFTTSTLYVDSFFETQNFTIPHVRYYYEQTDSGFFCRGIHIPRTVLPLAGSSDSIEFLEQDVVYSGDFPHPRFPLFLHHDWAYSTQDTIAFRLTVNPYIIDELGYVSLRQSGEHIIREEGDVLMPLTGDTVPALGLVQNRQISENFYLNNVLLADSVLQTMGYSDSFYQTNTGIFVTKDLNYFLGIVEFDRNASLTSGEIKSAYFLNPAYYQFTPSLHIPKYQLNVLQAYPNPSSDKLYLKLEPGKGRLASVYNLGWRHMATQIVNDNVVNIASLPSGVYFLKVIEHDEVLGVLKFVKE